MIYVYKNERKVNQKWIKNKIREHPYCVFLTHGLVDRARLYICYLNPSFYRCVSPCRRKILAK